MQHGETFETCEHKTQVAIFTIVATISCWTYARDWPNQLEMKKDSLKITSVENLPYSNEIKK